MPTRSAASFGGSEAVGLSRWCGTLGNKVGVGIVAIVRLAAEFDQLARSISPFVRRVKRNLSLFVRLWKRANYEGIQRLGVSNGGIHGSTQ